MTQEELLRIIANLKTYTEVSHGYLGTSVDRQGVVASNKCGDYVRVDDLCEALFGADEWHVFDNGDFTMTEKVFRVFSGSQTDQLDYNGNNAGGSHYYWEPADYEGDSLWSGWHETYQDAAAEARRYGFAADETELGELQ